MVFLAQVSVVSLARPSPALALRHRKVRAHPHSYMDSASAVAGNPYLARLGIPSPGCRDHNHCDHLGILGRILRNLCWSKAQRSFRSLRTRSARARSTSLRAVQWWRHLIVGQGLEVVITSFVSGYAVAVVPAVTGNGWGGTLVQTLTNAVGRFTN
jgi:hypothetical protein